MTRRLVPALVAALLGAATVVATVLTAAPASADPIARCTTRAGVLVAVDFRHFGGSISRGCDATPSTGLDALHEAGYSTEGTKHDGPAFVCRIDGMPSASQEPCYNTPPASAYWSYWHADSGQNRWTYAKTGAQDTHPGPGSVDAWVFGATGSGGSGGGPTFTPDQVRNPSGGSSPAAGSTPAPRPAGTRAAAPPRATTRTAGPAGSAGTARAAAPASTSARGATPTAKAPARSRTSAAASSSATTAASPSGSSGSSPGPTGAAGSGAPTVVDATPVASHAGGGSPLPLIVGLLLVLALAAGGGWTVYRRRQGEFTP